MALKFLHNSRDAEHRSNRQLMLESPWLASLWIIFVSLGLQFSTWRSLFHVWMDESRYSHGLLVAAVCAFLIYRQKKTLSATILVPQPPILLLLAVILFAWLLASLSGIEIGQQVLLPLILLASLMAVTGWNAARHFVLPVLYLFFAIPIWDASNSILQLMTVEVVGVALHLLHIPAWLDGNFVILPDGTFEVADGCSGIHFLIVASALSVLYGYLWLDSIWSRFWLVATAVMLALAANWLRVFVIVYAGHVSQMQHYLVKTEHYYWGWALFAFLMIAFFPVAKWIEEKELRRARITEPEVAPSGKQYDSSNHYSGAVVISMCCVLMGAATLLLFARSNVEPNRDVTINLPIKSSQWKILDVVDTDWKPLYVGAAAEDFQMYAGENFEISAYVALYLTQQEGQELIGYENRIQGIGRWNKKSALVAKILLPGGQSIKVNDVTLGSARGAQRIVYYWYEVGGRFVLGSLETKLLQALMRLAGKYEAGVIAISARCEEDCDEARRRIEKWMETVLVNDGGVRGPASLLIS